jgi:putative flippase GtrA
MPLPAAARHEVRLFRQILSFGLVGVAATFAHVALAWLLIDAAALNPYFANFLGACAAFGVSFFGNAGWTFDTDRPLWSSARRYIFVTLTSFVMTSAILAVTRHYGWPTYIYVGLVLALVPVTTFLLAKLWAFSPLDAKGDKASL